MIFLLSMLKLYYGGFLQVFKDLLKVKTLINDPETNNQTSMKLFRLFRTEVDILLLVVFYNNPRINNVLNKFQDYLNSTISNKIKDENAKKIRFIDF